MECKLIKTIEIGNDTLFIGEIVNTYTEDKYLSDGKPDITKIRPFGVTMPDNNYWLIGGWLEKAWSVGKKTKTSK